MTLHVRIYESDDAAKDAAARLEEAGYRDSSVILAGEAKGKEAETVASAVGAGVLPASQAAGYVKSLEKGHSLVAVEAPFSRGALAVGIMEGEGIVRTARPRRDSTHSPSPFSDALGIPTLSSDRPSAKLARSDWTFSSKIGQKLLSEDPAPFSSRFGLKTATTPKQNWDKSFGQPILSSEAAPLSSLLKMKTLTEPKKDWRSTLTFPLLINNPTPLSSLFCIPVLTKNKRSGAGSAQ